MLVSLSVTHSITRHRRVSRRTITRGIITSGQFIDSYVARNRRACTCTTVGTPGASILEGNIYRAEFSRLVRTTILYRCRQGRSRWSLTLGRMNIRSRMHRSRGARVYATFVRGGARRILTGPRPGGLIYSSNPPILPVRSPDRISVY